jgi:predicted RNase H-like nuclease (RuvC/YqgF family)
MRKTIRNILVAGMVVLWTMPAWCEYYQYRDEKGALRFTDDLSSVPPDQRPGVTTHQSVQSQPVAQKKGAAAEKSASRPPASEKQDSLPSGDTWEGKKARKLAEFDSKQAELNQTYTALQAERADLQANAPSKKASFEEKAVYNQKVTALNARIDRYEEEMAAFSQQVNDYNAQVKKQ